MNNLKIKVIKKNAAVIHQMPNISEKTQKQKAEREMALNVYGWVNEFQRRRCEEPRQAFNRLFAQCG